MRLVVAVVVLLAVGCSADVPPDYSRELECEPETHWGSEDFPQWGVPAACDPVMSGRDFETVPFHIRNSTGRPIVMQTANNSSLSPSRIEISRIDEPGRFPVDCWDRICDDWALAAQGGPCGCGMALVLAALWLEPTAIFTGQWEGKLAVSTQWEPACGEPCNAGECWRYIHPPAGRYEVSVAFTRGEDCSMDDGPCECDLEEEGYCWLDLLDYYDKPEPERVTVQFDYPTPCPGIEIEIE